MCGIAGIFSLSKRPIERAEERVGRMTELLRHRGPDSQGVYVSPDRVIALGNTRLAIVDPGCAVTQPIESLDGGAVLSFNGEIYNHSDLRAHLADKGIRFRTRMDTEVLLEGLRLEGTSFLDRVDGMWAFGYYDCRARRLFLSRDLLGERHVFYRIEGDELIFASEVKPILADAGRPFDTDFAALVTALRYHSAPPGKTLVAGVRRILPGHLLIADTRAGVEERRYRRLHPEKWFDFFRSEPELGEVVDRFGEILHRVVPPRIPQEVPYFSTLSGGLDSTLICVFASDFGTRQIATLYGQSTEVPPQATPDELDEYAASQFTAAKLGTKHHFARLNDDDCVPVLLDLAANGFDGLIDDGTASFGMLAHAIRARGAKVMLISDGPDELLGGYLVDQRAYRRDLIEQRSPLKYLCLKQMSSVKTGRRILRRLKHPELVVPSETADGSTVSCPVHEAFNADFLDRIIDREWIEATAGHYTATDSVYADILPDMDNTQRRALAYAANSLPDMFNLRTDKAFLRASVECRVPYQAPEVVEFALAAPAKFRFAEGGTTKFLMRQMVERHVGPEISTRAKHGFSAPLFNRPDVNQAMRFEEVIGDTPLFRNLPFKPDARGVVLNPKFRKLRWPFFVLARTHEKLQKGDYL